MLFFSLPIRFGQRSNWGLLQDGINSAVRYYKNNFADGFRQVVRSSFSRARSPFTHEEAISVVVFSSIYCV